MERVCAGDHSAFTILVQRHTDKFLALAFRSLNRLSDAEDVVQNSFIKLWQNPHSWQASKSQFTTWFYRVIINACHDARRKSTRIQQSIMEHGEQGGTIAQSEESNIQDQQNESWQQKCVMRALSDLPASQRDAINLVVYCEVPQRQAAQIMGISIKALESLLVRAKRSMTKTVNSLRAQENVVKLPRGSSAEIVI